MMHAGMEGIDLYRAPIGGFAICFVVFSENLIVSIKKPGSLGSPAYSIQVQCSVTVG